MSPFCFVELYLPLYAASYIAPLASQLYAAKAALYVSLARNVMDNNYMVSHRDAPQRCAYAQHITMALAII